MDLTDEYSRAVDRHESSIQRLSDLLEQYRDNADLSREYGPETELDAAAQQSQAGAFVLNIIQDFVPDAETWSVSGLLGRALKVAKPQEAAQVLVDAYPDSAPKAQKACAGVVAHHAKRRRLVRGLNLALPGCQLLHGPGVPLQVLATAVLLVYQVWLVHDHLDSPVMEEVRLPKNSGLLRQVRAAVA